MKETFSIGRITGGGIGISAWLLLHEPGHALTAKRLAILHERSST